MVHALSRLWVVCLIMSDPPIAKTQGRRISMKSLSLIGFVSVAITRYRSELRQLDRAKGSVTKLWNKEKEVDRTIDCKVEILEY